MLFLLKENLLNIESTLVTKSIQAYMAFLFLSCLTCHFLGIFLSAKFMINYCAKYFRCKFGEKVKNLDQRNAIFSCFQYEGVKICFRILMPGNVLKLFHELSISIQLDSEKTVYGFSKWNLWLKSSKICCNTVYLRLNVSFWTL